MQNVFDFIVLHWKAIAFILFLILNTTLSIIHAIQTGKLVSPKIIIEESKNDCDYMQSFVDDAVAMFMDMTNAEKSVFITRIAKEVTKDEDAKT